MTRIITRDVPTQAVNHLMAQGMNPIMAKIYAARGVSDTNELAMELAHLIAPQGLMHINEAAAYLADAIAKGKKLVIVADYDCDGATACAVGIRGLRMLGANVDYIVPNRFEYGYGLSPEIVALTIKEKQPDVIVTVDNGIASIDGVNAANEQGIDVVVTDHHLPGDHLPNAKVIVNPNQPHCGFPSKNLAGVGVIFYVLMATRAYMRNQGIFTQESQPKLHLLLDLVALGTVADVVKLDTNNRILVAQGLKRMRSGTAHAGINALFRAAGREIHKASPFDLGFGIGPRLNAAGRLADMSLGIECLITDDTGRAWDIAQQLDQINRERREIESDMQDTALTLLETFNPHEHRTISVFDESWHQGVIGIVASRLKEKFYRPTITFAPDDEQHIKGSGRSIAGFHLRDALDLVSKKVPDVITKFGGHAMAAGLTIRKDLFPQFNQAFEEVGQAWLSDTALDRVIETDGQLDSQYYSIDFIDYMAQQVWGQGFAAPVFCDEFTVISQRILKEKHLKLLLERQGQRYDAIWFGHNTMLGEHATVAFRLDSNEFNGSTKVQLMVEYAE